MNPTAKASIRSILYTAQKGLCCYCECRMFPPRSNMKRTCRCYGLSKAGFRSRLATIEHLKRRCEGGTNHPDNLALACQECNSTRGNRTWLVFKSIKMGEVVQ